MGSRERSDLITWRVFTAFSVKSRRIPSPRNLLLFYLPTAWGRRSIVSLRSYLLHVGRQLGVHAMQCQSNAPRSKVWKKGCSQTASV